MVDFITSRAPFLYMCFNANNLFHIIIQIDHFMEFMWIRDSLVTFEEKNLLFVFMEVIVMCSHFNA